MTEPQRFRVQCSFRRNLTRFIDEFSVQLKICRVCRASCVVFVLTSTWWSHGVSNCPYIERALIWKTIGADFHVRHDVLLNWQTVRGTPAINALVQTTQTVLHHRHSPLKVTNLIIRRQYGSVCHWANAIELVYFMRYVAMPRDTRWEGDSIR